MEKKFFEDLQSRKSLVKQYAIKAKEFGWIDEQRMNETITKLDNDTLVIGVIGQMKCGKSTFLNSFVFEDDILPVATTPMTAALSIIKYGDNKKVVAEFYNQDEWAEQQMQAKRNLSEITNELELSKVKAAKELVDKSQLLGGDVTAYLGKTKEDTFDNLVEYVGADGKYVSITKAVTVYYPKDYLKGVEIVDTPGFNDPIVSREERTKDFLKRADVVILLLYSERAFDSTDQSILFQNVRSCGIGKVIVGINKYDIPFCNRGGREEGDIDAIVKYVKDEITKACTQCHDSRLIDILQDVTPIPISAEMALLSQLPMSKIQQNEDYLFHWNKHCEDFGISTQSEMWENSRLQRLIDAIIQMIEKEKGQILFAKPINSILAAGNKILEENEKELKDCDAKIVVYSTPDEEVEDKQANLQKAMKRMERKISSLEDTLDEEYDNILRNARNEMEDLVDTTVKRLNRIVDDWGTFQDYDTIHPQICNEIDKLQTRDLKRCMQEQQSYAQRKLRSALDDFFAETDEIIWKYLPDFDQKGFLNEVKREIKLTIDEDIFKIEPNEQEEQEYGFWNFVEDFFNGATYGLGKKVINAIEHSEQVGKMKELFGSFSTQFDATEYLQTILESKDTIINKVKEKYQNEFLLPIQNEFDELVANADSKEKILAESKEKKESLSISNATIREQLEEIGHSLQSI